MEANKSVEQLKLELSKLKLAALQGAAQESRMGKVLVTLQHIKEQQISALNFISTTTKVMADERNTLTARQGISTVSTQNQRQTKLLLENALATVSTDYSSIKGTRDNFTAGLQDGDVEQYLSRVSSTLKQQQLTCHYKRQLLKNVEKMFDNDEVPKADDERLSLHNSMLNGLSCESSPCSYSLFEVETCQIGMSSFR